MGRWVDAFKVLTTTGRRIDTEVDAATMTPIPAITNPRAIAETGAPRVPEG
jgi:hypothetical protein